MGHYLDGYVSGLESPDCIVIPTQPYGFQRRAFLDGVADGQQLARQLVPMRGLSHRPT